MSVNKAILIGRVGKNPEIKHLESGVSVANFSLATSEKYTNKQGEKVETTEWHNIVIWGKLVKIIEDYVSKGILLYIEGKIKTRNWEDKNGAKHYITEIVLEGFNSTLKLLSSKPEQQTQPEKQQFVKQTTLGVGDLPNDEPDNKPPF